MTPREYRDQGPPFRVKRYFWRCFHPKPKETMTSFLRRKEIENAGTPRHSWPHWQSTPFVYETWMGPLATGAILGAVLVAMMMLK